MKVKLFNKTLGNFNKVWFSSDLHLNHEAVLKFGRKFTDIQTMNHYIYEHINAKCEENDLLVLIGDTMMIDKNYNDFIEIITNNYNDITHISYDHDLADEHYTKDMYSGEEKYNKYYDSFKERTGLDCAKFVKTFYHNNNLELPTMFVHSMNPVGTQNIINLWK